VEEHVAYSSLEVERKQLAGKVFGKEEYFVLLDVAEDAVVVPDILDELNEEDSEEHQIHRMVALRVLGGFEKPCRWSWSGPGWEQRWHSAYARDGENEHEDVASRPETDLVSAKLAKLSWEETGMRGHQARLNRTTVKNALGVVCSDESGVDWEEEEEEFWCRSLLNA
jgi:hypothetical protein